MSSRSAPDRDMPPPSSPKSRAKSTLLSVSLSWREHARATLRRLGYHTVHVVEGDGTLGWSSAAPPTTPSSPPPRESALPPSLRAQLKPGGRLVMPVAGGQFGQSLMRLTRGPDGEDKMEDLQPVRFVPLIGAEGWSATERRPIEEVAISSRPYRAAVSMTLVVSALPKDDEPVEIVERKGIGHPDLMCDALAETLSRNLCRYYLDRFGEILHHNVDKALLCAAGTPRRASAAGR